MVRLATWQFRYTWETWLGSLIIFSAAGFIVGFSLIGVTSSIRAKLNYGVYDPVTLFSTPAIFGLITLILIISGITQLIINKFKSDYELWFILGANSRQLAVMIGFQMSLMGMIGGFLGYFCSYPVAGLFYTWVRTNPGMSGFPSMDIRMQWDSLILTIIGMGIMTGAMGFLNGKKLFDSKNVSHKLVKKIKNKVSLIVHWGSIIGSYGGLIYVYGLFYKNPHDLIKLFGSTTLENAYMQALLALIILMIMAINTSKSLILPVLIKSLPYRYLTRLMNTFPTAYWSVLKKRNFLQSVTFPMFIFSLIFSFFMYLAFDLANVASRRSLPEMFGTLILFLGAPFLVILANVISLTIISSSERSSSTRQLNIIGFSLQNLVSEKGVEASIYGFIVFIQGTIGNILLYMPILQSSYNTHTQMRDSWLSVTWIPAVAGLLVFLFMFLVDGFYILKINLSNK